MSTVDWNLITQTLSPKKSYNIFIDKVLKVYDEPFPVQKVATKTKNIRSHWMTAGIRKS